MVSRFPDSPDSPSKTAPFNSLRPRVCSDYFSLEDRVVFWCSGAYKKYPRSYGADHRVCGDHCPTSGHSGPRTPVNDLKVRQVRHRAPTRDTGGRRTLPAHSSQDTATAQLQLSLEWTTRETRNGLRVARPPVVCVESRGQYSRGERKNTDATHGRDGRTARRHHTGILRRGV